MTDIDDSLEVAKRAARAGAAVLRELFGSSVRVQEKVGDKGLVTEADRRAEEAILSILQKESQFPILSEEAGLIGGAHGPRWIVDPLDGTTNFARGIPLFAVSIALVEGFDARLGVIIDPMRGNIYCAELSRGAHIGSAAAKPQVNVDHTPALFINHGYAEPDRLRSAEVTKRLVGHTSVRKLGSTALELAYVASGHVDAFICSGDEFWDFAAGIAIAAEAGCLVSDWKGSAWNGSHSFVMVARPELQSMLIQAVGDLQAE